MDKYLDSFDILSLDKKREILLDEIFETLLFIEKICLKRKIRIDKLKSSNYIKNKKLIFDEDYFNLMFIYVTYLKEDLASLLEKGTC